MRAQKKVFVSHSSQDKDRCDRLVAELENRGIQCWVAHRDIAPGTSYPEEILAGIASSDAMIVLVSSDSIRSPHVEREVERAVSTGKPVYPLRLVDIEIAGALEYLLSVRHQIDIFDGPSESAYENLANAIKKGVSPATGKPIPVQGQKSLTGWIVAAAIALGALLFAIFGSGLWQQPAPQIASQPEAGSADTKKAEEVVPGEDFSVEMWYSDNNSSSLTIGTTANGYLYGFPLQDRPAQIAIFDELSGGRFRKLADSEITITSEGSLQAYNLFVAEKPEQTILCIKYRGLNEKGRSAEFYYTRQFFQSPVLGAAKSKVFKAEPGMDCEALLGLKNVEDKTAAIADFEKRKRIEQAYTFSEISNVSRIQNDLNGFKVDLYKQGGFSKEVDSDRVSNVELRIFASDDGENWKFFHGTGENFSFTNFHYENIQRPAPPFVRACVSTFIKEEQTYVIEDGSYRRNGSKGLYEFSSYVPERMFLDPEGTTCKDIDPTIGEVKIENLDPIDVLIPASSGGIFDSAERTEALAVLKSGLPQEFGPSVSGFRLGMSMEEARKLALEQLPWSVRVDALVDRLWIYNKHPHGTPEMRYDPQLNRVIVLLPYRGVDALAGVWVGFRPWQQRTVSVQEFTKKLLSVYGPQNPDEGAESSSHTTLVWSQSKNNLCRYSGYDFESGVWDLANSPLTSSEVRNALFQMKAPTPDPSLGPGECEAFLMAQAFAVPDNPNYIFNLFDPQSLWMVASSD